MVALCFVQDAGPRDAGISRPAREETVSSGTGATCNPRLIAATVTQALTRFQERDDSASSFVADFLNEHENKPEEEKLCQQVATSFYGGAWSADRGLFGALIDSECEAGADTVCEYKLEFRVRRSQLHRPSLPCFPSFGLWHNNPVYKEEPRKK